MSQKTRHLSSVRLRIHPDSGPGISNGVVGAWKKTQGLRLAAAAYGNSWMEVAEVIAGRTNEQCRDRWSDKINPNITKGKWTDDEDKLLLEAVESMGTNWKGVSERLGNGRTDSNVGILSLSQISVLNFSPSVPGI